MDVVAKPFIKWAGGKTQLIDEIDKKVSFLLSTKKDYTYIEPFIGGGAVLFYILQKYPNDIKRAIINDLNSDLIKTYKIVKDNPKDLIKSLEQIKNKFISFNNKEDKKLFYHEQRDLFNTKTLNDIQCAVLFIFLNKTCFNGMYRVNKKGNFNTSFGSSMNPQIFIEQNILKISQLLQKVKILNVDFSETLEYVNKNTLFYFDPPYKPLSETSNFKSYTKEVFDDKEQIRLRDYCDQINNMNYEFILSNSDLKNTNKNNQFFDELYKEYNIQRVLATRRINPYAKKNSKITELLISNF